MRNPFKRKKDFNELEEYTDYDYEETNYEVEEYNAEPQIIESISLDELESYKKQHEKKYKKTKRLINIIFTIIIVLLSIVTIDVIAVSRYNVGPFFAIKTSTLKDGGTKIYYGIGYKVIKYHQEQGRRDKEIGFWNLKYNAEPIDISDIDLAIEFENNYEQTSNKYYKQFVRLSSNVKKIDKKNNLLVLEYLDEDSKYTLDLYCTLANKKELDFYKKEDTINLIGTIDRFKVKTNKTSNRVYISNCFTEPTTIIDNTEIEE